MTPWRSRRMRVARTEIRDALRQVELVLTLPTSIDSEVRCVFARCALSRALEIVSRCEADLRHRRNSTEKERHA